MTSETALEARKEYLYRELEGIQAELDRELTKLTGDAIVSIEAIAQRQSSRIQTEDLRAVYAQYVRQKIFRLLGMQAPR